MKARVKETGEIIDVEHIVHTLSDGREVERYETEDAIYVMDDLDFDVKEKSLPKDEPDYWEKLKHQYAGMFLQGMIIGKPFTRDYVEDAYQYSTALVNRLKEEEK